MELVEGNKKSLLFCRRDKKMASPRGTSGSGVCVVGLLLGQAVVRTRLFLVPLGTRYLWLCTWVSKYSNRVA